MSYAAFAEHYDSLSENMDYEKRMDYFCALLARFGAVKQASVLDLACGTGSYTYALLRRGYDVIGVDASPDMLSVAREKAEAYGVAPPLLLCQKLEALDLYGTSRAALCLTDSINHITDPKKVQAFFKRLKHFIEPGGVFIFDANTLYKQRDILADNVFVYENARVYCVWQNHWQAERRLTDIHLDLFVRGENGYTRCEEQFSERVHSDEDLTSWLLAAGFTLEHTEDFPGEEGQRRVWIARKR